MRGRFEVTFPTAFLSAIGTDKASLEFRAIAVRAQGPLKLGQVASALSVNCLAGVNTRQTTMRDLIAARVASFYL